MARPPSTNLANGEAAEHAQTDADDLDQEGLDAHNVGDLDAVEEALHLGDAAARSHRLATEITQIFNNNTTSSESYANPPASRRN